MECDGDLLNFIASRSISKVPNRFSRYAWLTKGVILWVNEHQAHHGLPYFNYTEEVSSLPSALNTKQFPVPFMCGSDVG